MRPLTRCTPLLKRPVRRSFRTYQSPPSRTLYTCPRFLLPALNTIGPSFGNVGIYFNCPEHWKNHATHSRRFLSSDAARLVEKGDRVEAHMKVVDPASGATLVESKTETVSFVVGQGQVIPGIERACEGLKEGETWSGQIQPEEAFGIVNSELIYDIPLERIPADVHKDLAVGTVLQIEARNTAARIVEMSDSAITVDENHELAGKALDFTIDVVSIAKGDEAAAWTSVQKQTLRDGDGINFPQPGDRVKIHYEGTLASNGKMFDSSRQRNSPLVVQIGAKRVISGFEIGLPMMSLGEKAKLFIPSSFAYGPQGAGDVIPPDANLVFEIQILAINDQEM